MSPLQPTDGLLNRLPGGKRALKKLTLHEEKFIRLICTDLSYQDIADEMSINLSTAYSYRDALFRKFKVNNRSQMILYCVREGLVFL
jgi:DNA-binding CsgD family transcriptional regulator